MFSQNTLFTIHLSTELCGQPSTTQAPSYPLRESVKLFLSNNYPKMKLLPIVFDILIDNNMINDQFYFVDHPEVHILDFIRYINNRFTPENDKPPIQISKLLKSFSSLGVRLPQACVLNQTARKYIC